MKKIEMIKELESYDITIPDLKWGPFQNFYKDKMSEVKISLSKPTEDSVDERVERKIEKVPDLRTDLEKLREELFPKIVDLMIRLKGKRNATQPELREMFEYYNQFYLRSDNPSCGSCVGRVYSTFKKICKGRI